ncbi:cellulase [Aestuariibacter sp. GS-14]|uniref:glycoside hydrolase family 9 protein n=1 Tax=Aestuariibacter sp. GS-14 TaxID=2590670 RepID=UPI00112CB8B5|nr:glycoside hydrolase family 9 protein [Aestuariibacter sp. GS-14]TPV56437.1 cellulase [Aestuariibacter sp. GS-14]
MKYTRAHSRYPFTLSAAASAVVLLLSGCSGGGTGNTSTNTPPPVVSTPDNVAIYANQVGFIPEQEKEIVITANQVYRFDVTKTDNNQVVLSGESSQPMMWPLAGESASIIDISTITEEGNYRLTLDGSNDSISFAIRNDAYGDVHDAAIKAYYFNRASFALDPAYAGQWQRPAGHPDDQAAVLDNPSDVRASAKGWYDAGDYNKYIVNSGISTYTLLRAYLDFGDFYANRQWNIPESTNTQPDMLDEIVWNLDWMATMQDSDGSVFHKLTTLNFAPEVMPHEANEQRYFVGKGTAAALNFAAVMATAARVFPASANTYQNAAERAWQWAVANPDMPYTNPENVRTGEYGDTSFGDEFAWAASELLITTGKAEYLDAVSSHLGAPSTPSWGGTMGLAYLSLLKEGESRLAASDYQTIKQDFLNYADQLVTADAESAFHVAMRENDFVWGSNGVAMNHGMLLATAYSLTENESYRTAMSHLVDYVLGKNPTGYSFVTGFGTKPPRFIHHRQSQADDVADPVPGFVAGGPHSGQQDGCTYPSALPATSYVDDWCSYASNEVAINWNAPLVYTLAAMNNLY